MAQPVWTLSVDLQTKTATFQSGMADAAKAARGSFNDIKSGAGEMCRETSTNMGEARHGVMLLGEEFGIHLPRALTSFVASLGPIGAAMEAAFPFLAIVVGATLLLEHLAKMKAAGEALTESQIKFGTVTANVLGDLDEKLLQAGIRADELNGNHLAALDKELQLIDRQSMKELVHSFDEVAKAADAVFTNIDKHSLTASLMSKFGAGAEGAKHALKDFQTQYDSLLAQGKDKEAGDLLAGTLSKAKEVLALQEQANKSQHSNTADQSTFEAIRKLSKEHISNTDESVEAQRQLVDALQAQVAVQTKIGELKDAQKDNASKATENTMDAESDKIFRQQMEEKKKAQEFEDAQDEQRYKDAVDAIQQAEREKIAATEQGSKQRLAAIDAAIKDENSKGLQETAFYKQLLTERVNTARELSQEQKKLDADAKTEEASHSMKMDELKVAAERENQALLLATKRRGDQERVRSDENLENQEYQAKMDAYAKQIDALDKTAKDYENKLKALQNREAELTQAHENKITAIREQAEIDRANRILSGERHLEDSIANGLASVLLRHQSFGKMILSLGDEIASGMIQNAIKSIMADDMTKEHDAAAAARKMFLAGSHFPFPVNIVMAPTLAAAAFASVMAFEEGGIVPGVGRGDIVNAKLEPGETVIPKQMTERLNRAAGDAEQGPRPVHVSINHAPTIHALDAESMERVLKKNADVLTRHVHNTLRKMNK